MEEPQNTCPDIDASLRRLKDVRNQIKDILNSIEDILYEVGHVENSLEELRGMNASLREYGNYWENRAKEMEAEE